MHAARASALGWDVAGHFAANREQNGIKRFLQFFQGQVFPDFGVALEHDALLFHHLDTTCDDVFLQFVIRDAIGQQTARRGVAFKYLYPVPQLVQLIGSRHACWPRTNDGHGFARTLRRQLGGDPAPVPSDFGDFLLDVFNRDWLVVESQDAGRFARGGADAPGEFREVVGRAQHLVRLAEVTSVDGVVEFRNAVAEWAPGVAKGHTAIHAPRRLGLGLFTKRRIVFFEVLHAFFWLADIGEAALDLQKTGVLTHGF